MTRMEMINALIANRGFKSYLEIGVQNGFCFEEINCQYKVGVDPEKRYEHLTHVMTSDEFFAQNTEMFDIVFIDGLHLDEQVQLDFQNSFRALKPGGMILLHDCNPTDELWQRRYIAHDCWCGDTWKAWVRIMASYPKNTKFTVDDDYGVGVFVKNFTEERPIVDMVGLNWEYLEAARKNILNLVSVNKFVQFVNDR